MKWLIYGGALRTQVRLAAYQGVGLLLSHASRGAPNSPIAIVNYVFFIGGNREAVTLLYAKL